MFVQRLQFENFRNLQDDEIEPCDGINVIYGENAQGKTNLLESLWLFTGGHSFRGAKDIELSRLEHGQNAPFCRLQLHFYSQERDQKAELHIVKGKRSSIINGVKKKTGSALIGKVCAVIFSPEHLMLVKAGPSKRRSFIDGAICQIKPSYAKILGVYNRSLLQRNTLLKDMTRHPELADTLVIWNMRLAKLGAQVMAERYRYVERIKDKIVSIYNGISRNREKISLSYQPSVKVKPEQDVLAEEQLEILFQQELVRYENSDIRTGFTAVGPHRDDIEILINDLSAKLYGSQGQQRSVVLAMKLAESEMLAEYTGEKPIVLLDDVMSELDKSRQDYLLNHLHARQVFITCCAPETVNLMETGKRFYVSEGKITAG